MIRMIVKHQEREAPPKKSDSDNYMAELEKEWEKEKEEARNWLETKKTEHGQESAFFAGWSTASKGIVFFDVAKVFYVDGVEHHYSTLEDCKLVVVYDDEEDDDAVFDEMEYEEELRKRRNNVIGSVVIGSAVGGTIGAAIGAMVAESDSDNFIARYLPKSNASREINHYEIKIAFKGEREYVVFELSSYDELDAQRVFNYLLRIIAQNLNPVAAIPERGDIADKLLRVADLVKEGLISNEEFEKVKEKLLTSLAG